MDYGALLTTREQPVPGCATPARSASEGSRLTYPRLRFGLVFGGEERGLCAVYSPLSTARRGLFRGSCRLNPDRPATRRSARELE